METPFQKYQYESIRIKKYILEFYELVEKLDIDAKTEDKLIQLFTWYGNARAIKSKAYQEMKTAK